MQPLPGIHAVERLVEEQDRRVVDERAGDLGALAHALRVRPDRAIGRLGQVDRGDRPGGGRVRVGDALQSRVEARELETGQVRVDGLALGDEPDVAVHLGSAPGGRALDEDAAGRRCEEAGHQVQERRLAGAVRAEQAGHARAEPERDVVDGHDVPVPARDVVELERRGRARRGRGRRRRGGRGGAPSAARRRVGSVASVMPRS